MLLLWKENFDSNTSAVTSASKLVHHYNKIKEAIGAFKKTVSAFYQAPKCVKFQATREFRQVENIRTKPVGIEINIKKYRQMARY